MQMVMDVMVDVRNYHFTTRYLTTGNKEATQYGDQSQTARSYFYAIFNVAQEREEDMAPEIVVALMSLAGTLSGSLLGVITSNRLTNYRIAQLEEKVNKHNNLVERMVVVEQSTKSAHHRLDELAEEKEK